MITFHALLIHLQATQQAELPATQGHLAHAAFLALIDTVNPELAQKLHDFKGRKPFTLSPVWGLKSSAKKHHHVNTGQQLRLRLTLLDIDLFHAFMQKLLTPQNQTLRLGNAHFLITQVLGAPESSPWSGYATADTLMQNATQSKRITLQFASPTALGLGRTDSGKPRRETLPIPRYVWASLRGSWRAFTGQDIPQTFEDWVERNVVVSRIENWRTAMFRFNKGLQIGGLGQISYEALDDTPAMLRHWNTLADFAFYSGVGIKTSMGMGVVRKHSHDA